MAMKIRLSIPRIISRSVSVKKLNHKFGSINQSMNLKPPLHENLYPHIVEKL
jgi:hypothetical protein